MGHMACEGLQLIEVTSTYCQCWCAESSAAHPSLLCSCLNRERDKGKAKRPSLSHCLCFSPCLALSHSLSPSANLLEADALFCAGRCLQGGTLPSSHSAFPYRKRHAVSSSKQSQIVYQNNFVQNTSRSLLLAEGRHASLREVRRNEIIRPPCLKQSVKSNATSSKIRKHPLPAHLCFVAVRQASVGLPCAPGHPCCSWRGREGMAVRCAQQPVKPNEGKHQTCSGRDHRTLGPASFMNLHEPCTTTIL